MNNIWLTSDTHFSHSNLIFGTSKWDNKSGCRQFQTIEEHDNTILANINDLVKENDILYHLGDFALGKDKMQKVIDYRNKIRCKAVKLCRGNHDSSKYELEHSNAFDSVNDYLEVKLKSNRKFLVLCHYPIISWNDMKHGTFHVHGHSHGNLKVKHGRMMDVGLDTNNLKPYHIDEVISILDKIPVEMVDHHV